MAAENDHEYEDMYGDEEDAELKPDGDQSDWSHLDPNMMQGQSMPQRHAMLQGNVRPAMSQKDMAAAHYSYGYQHYMTGQMNYNQPYSAYYGVDPSTLPPTALNGGDPLADATAKSVASRNEVSFNTRNSSNTLNNSVAAAATIPSQSKESFLNKSNPSHNIQNWDYNSSLSVSQYNKSATAEISRSTYSSPKTKHSNSGNYSNSGVHNNDKNLKSNSNKDNNILQDQLKSEANFGKSHSKFSSHSLNKHHSSPYSRMTQQNKQDPRDKPRNAENDDKQKLIHSLAQTRNELKNLRQSVRGLREQHKKDFSHLEGLLDYSSARSDDTQQGTSEDACVAADGSDANGGATSKGDEAKARVDPLFQNWKPIGFMESAYMHKSGTPRQGCLVKESRGRIRVLDALFNNPHHSLDGLQQYSHVWLIFAFDQNSSDPSTNVHTKAKVAPPRLGGRKLGVFATRSPHRPNPIGITLAKLDAVEGSTVHVSGIDILFGTAILDIKPYIPEYDAPVTQEPVSKDQLLKTLFDASKESVNAEVAVGGISKLNFSEDESAVAMSIGKSLDGSYLGGNCAISKSKPKISNLNMPSKGIVITKLKSTSNYDHIIAKVADETAPSNGTCSAVSQLSTSEQLRNALLTDEAVNSATTLNGAKVTDVATGGVTTADWLREANEKQLDVIFNPIAEKQLKEFSTTSGDPKHKLSYCRDSVELRDLICSTLRSDTRSYYRRSQCPDVLYHFAVEGATVTAAFVEDGAVEVLRVRAGAAA